jgi:hypothetical protein
MILIAKPLSGVRLAADVDADRLAAKRAVERWKTERRRKRKLLTNAQAALVSKHESIIAYQIYRFIGRWPDKNNIADEERRDNGLKALMRAARAWRKNGGAAFATYAHTCVRNGVRMKLKTEEENVSLSDDAGEDDDGNTLTSHDVTPRDWIGGLEDFTEQMIWGDEIAAFAELCRIDQMEMAYAKHHGRYPQTGINVSKPRMVRTKFKPAPAGRIRPSRVWSWVAQRYVRWLSEMRRKNFWGDQMDGGSQGARQANRRFKEVWKAQGCDPEKKLKRKGGERERRCEEEEGGTPLPNTQRPKAGRPIQRHRHRDARNQVWHFPGEPHEQENAAHRCRPRHARQKDQPVAQHRQAGRRGPG